MEWIKVGSIGIEKTELEKALAEQKLRIVGMTDVTVTKEQLSKVLIKARVVPGNESIKTADTILKHIVLGDDIGKLASVEEGGEAGS